MGTDAPRTARHGWGRFWVGLLVAVLVIAVVAAGVGWWTVQRSFPTATGRIVVSGLSAPAAVYRDDAGIPHIVAETDADLFFAQGYVHAQDRFWEMDVRRHATAGRLAELFGESQVPTDAFVRTLDWRGVAEEEYGLLDAPTRAAFDAYAEGVNAYLDRRSGAALSLEYALLSLQRPGYEPEPWTAIDSIAWLKAMAWDLRSNLGDEIDRALLSAELPPEEVARLHPAFPFGAKPTIVDGPVAASPAAEAVRPIGVSGAESAAVGAAVPDPAHLDALASLAGVIDGMPELLGPEGGDLGSNSWVVSGALTESGLPLLANDPHLGPAMPSIWTQTALRCAQVNAACHYDVAGFGFAGLPGVVIGHNDRIAWGLTNLAPDVADLYLERVQGDSYELDGALVPLTTREEVIEVAGGEPVTITVRETGRGPIVSGTTPDLGRVAEGYAAVATPGEPPAAAESESAVSLQWTALTPGTTPSAILAINRARSWEEFRAAAEVFDVPAQNLVYADVDGNIGYQAPGRIPVRAAGDGTLPMPGWTSANGWTGLVDFGDLPSVLNPDRGYLVTANNAVDDDGPVLTRDWDLGYRAERIEVRLAELIASGEPLTADRMAELQLDTHDANAAALLPVIAELDLEGGAARGARLLDGWDASAAADSAEAAYFAVFWRTLLDRMFGDLPESTRPEGGDRWFSVVQTLLGQPDDAWWTDDETGAAGRDAVLAASLDAAWSEAGALMGDDPAQWRWGTLHTLSLEHSTFGSSGIGAFEWVFNRGPFGLGGGSAIVDANGWDASVGYEVDWVPSMRMVVDLSDFDDSTWINLTGTSGHAFHPNYDDQAELWRSGDMRPWAFSVAAVRETTRQALQLRPPGDTTAGAAP
ncbi:penicillin acylase family protein [Agromyces arachidis]|uniref:penicillin acylase family protein n=1 Tax=Agromyces arachidis TaxID=766966 RepID=UPI004057BD20